MLDIALPVLNKEQTKKNVLQTMKIITYFYQV